jgi:hypothetical protein
VAKSKKVKTGSNLTNFSMESHDSKMAVVPVAVATTMMMITFLFLPFS